MTINKSVLIMSPHIDDAFLSLGGTIHLLSSKGVDIKVVNVFSKTNFSIKPSMTDIQRIRRNEEMLNANLVRNISSNNNIDVEFLGIPDAVMRGHKVNDVLDYPRGNTHMEEYSLKTELVSIIKNLIKTNKKSTIFIPLGIGNHIDHVILRDAFFESMPTGYNKQVILGYEEQPYSFIRSTTVEIPKEKEVLFTIDPKVKAAIVRNYSSQIHEVEKFIKSLEEYSERFSDRPCERCIRISTTNK
ncbi:PIG-L deacetylase family protein [Paraliobacillus sp. X-1268]|uniref:PIG-L deacetylase family protein n=1 Tax=Paraliobacillus sp. X-1268 TaxID=2213193 RepID=UPI000E3B8138|nr:PIG-L family deacetylase [Paraliobacillus sp. X-1268]